MARYQRDWDDARAKVEAEGVCRACGRGNVRLEAAHVIGRSNDEARECPPCAGTGHTEEHLPCPKCKGAGMVLWVNPLDVVPLCGPNADQRSCHYRYDHKSLNLLGSLWHEEQVRAVLVAGMPGTKSGIVLAYIRTTGEREEPTAPVADPVGLPEW